MLQTCSKTGAKCMPIATIKERRATSPSLFAVTKNTGPAYYQLANTYLALQEYDLAKKYYEGCIEQMPDFKTAKSCKLALDHIAVMQPGSNAPGLTPGQAPDEPNEDPLFL